MQALVTGGAGFIGSHIAQRLLAEGHAVRILDNLSSGSRVNLDAASGAVFIKGDITVQEDCERGCRDCDVVFHHAAMVSVQESIANPQKSFANNVQGTLNLLHAANRSGVRRIIFASSAAVYGDEPTLPKHEAMPCTTISPYGADKAAAELYVLLAGKLWGMEPVILRYFNVFGPRQDPQGEYAAVIPKFVEKLVKGESPTVFGDGNQTRDFLHIDDIVEANLLAATNPAVAGGTFNIARGEPLTLIQVLDLLRDAIGTDVQAIFTEPRDGDIVHSAADITRARNIFGFEPKVSLPDGFRQTADYFRSLVGK